MPQTENGRSDASAKQPQPRCEVGECDGSGWITTRDEQGRMQFTRCRCLENAGRRWRIAKAFDGGQWPEAHRTGLAGLDPRDPEHLVEARHYVSGWPQKRGLTIIGPRGVGKTTMAYAIAFDLSSAGASVLCRRTATLLRRLRDGIDDGQLSARVDALSEADLVVLDDLGAHQASEWALERLFEIVDERKDQRRPTIVTTMFPLFRLAVGAVGRGDDMWRAIIRRLIDANDDMVLSQKG